MTSKSLLNLSLTFTSLSSTILRPFSRQPSSSSESCCRSVSTDVAVSACCVSFMYVSCFKLKKTGAVTLASYFAAGEWVIKSEKLRTHRQHCHSGIKLIMSGFGVALNLRKDQCAGVVPLMSRYC